MNAINHATQIPHNSSRKPLARLKHSLWALRYPRVAIVNQRANITLRRGKWTCLRALGGEKLALRP
jgi:hypothetical protein